MTNRKQRGLKLGVLGVATTGLLWQAFPASAQTANSNGQSAPAQVTRPLSRFDVGRRSAAPRKLAPSQNTNVSALPAQQAAPATIVNAVPMATAGQQPDVLQASAANSGKSDVQKQLEALYQADGREMPDMTLNLQPLNPQGVAPQQITQQQQMQGGMAPNGSAATPAPQAARKGYNQYQPNRTQAAPYPAQATTQNQQPNAQMAQANADPAHQQGPHRPNPVLKFFKKINGSNRSQPQTNPAPVPPDYANNQIQATQPAVNRPANVSPAWSLPAQSPANMPPVLSQQAAPAQPAQSFTQAPPTTNAYTAPKAANPIGQSTVASTPHRPSPKPAVVPLLSDSPMPIQTTSARSSTPKTKSESQGQVTIVKKSVTRVEDDKISVAEKSTEFFDPFPEGSELEADVKIRPGQREEIAPPATVAITSKSEAEAPKTIEPPAEVLAELPTAINAETDIAAKRDDDNPFAVEAKDFIEPLVADTKDPAAPSLDGEPALMAPPTDDATPAMEGQLLAVPEAIEVTDETELVSPTVSPIEKMKRIRERFGMKGLKGFCPVTLREDRELIDARPEFSSTHRGQRFHFASAEAREKFEENPSRFVPAAYGADVVALSRDRDVVEGSLDFAAWYKGRLYLFGSQDNYDAFIAEPTQFATIDGLE